MNELEQELRTLLGTKAGDAPVASRPEPRVLRRTRRRQVRTAAAAVVGAVAVVLGSIVGIRAIGSPSRPTPADRSIVTTTVNGITISHPEEWFVADPDEIGLNGETEPPGAPELPRLVLAMSPSDPGGDPSSAFACPGLAGASAPTFIMTVQEQPLALTGPASTPWPVQLEPGDFAGDQCHPGWELLRTSWTTAGRTFQATVGFDPAVSDADRDALYAAFASMTFEPVAEGGVASVVLATGTAGGEHWELIAARQPDGLVLTLQGETFGAATGGFDPTSDQLRLTQHVFGNGAQAERVVFSAVPADVTLIAVVGRGFAVEPEVLDVPDGIDPRMNAFVVVVDADSDIAIRGFDATDDLVVSGGLTAEGNLLEISLPVPDEVLFEGRLNNCWWSLTRTSEGAGAHRLRLDSPLGDVLAELVVGVGPGAPALQLTSFNCPIDGTTGVLLFGVISDEAATIRWGDGLGSEGLPDCLEAEIPSGFCAFLLDLSGPGEAIALDAGGEEIARVPYG